MITDPMTTLDHVFAAPPPLSERERRLLALVRKHNREVCTECHSDGDCVPDCELATVLALYPEAS